MKIVSYNLNGIRAALKKGFLEWVKKGKYDIVCIQETKAHQDQLDSELFSDLGYNAYWHSAEKKGYSGVLILSKIEPLSIKTGIDIERYDVEGRVIKTEYKNFELYNIYFPSGSSGDIRHEFKMDFLNDLAPIMQKELKRQKNLIVVGDYNIVHTEMDIHNPKRKDNPSGYRPEERAWLSQWFDMGFVDAYRHIHPDEVNFSWWSYQGGSRDRDKGWRIDYQSVSNALADKIQDCYMLKDDKHSDHCAVVMEIDL